MIFSRSSLQNRWMTKDASTAEHSSTVLVSFKDVSFYYTPGQFIFKNLSFCLARGSFHYLTGASGVGKSSLIKLLMLSLRFYEGQICVFGQNVRHIFGDATADYRRKIGVVYQNFLLLDSLTALENVMLPLRLKGMGLKETRQKAQTLLEWIGLGDLEHSYPSNLSGGQKQRLAIARAVINQPPLVIADEPTGNVDDENAVKLLQLFKVLHRQGTTIIFATHNRDLIAEFPQPALHLEQGHLTYVSTTELSS